MQPPIDEKRKTIVHDFAKWTALSALRSGAPIKSRQEVYDLIENHGNLAAILEPGGSIHETDFDAWHKNTVRAFSEAEARLKNQAGWAAKIVNVYLKTSVYLAGAGRRGLVSAIHPPIDTCLQQGLNESFPDRPWRVMRIKEIRSYEDDYLPFIRHVRLLAKEHRCLPIELECYWQSGRAGGSTGRRQMR